MPCVTTIVSGVERRGLDASFAVRAFRGTKKRVVDGSSCYKQLSIGETKIEFTAAVMRERSTHTEMTRNIAKHSAQHTPRSTSNSTHHSWSSPCFGNLGDVSAIYRRNLHGNTTCETEIRATERAMQSKSNTRTFTTPRHTARRVATDSLSRRSNNSILPLQETRRTTRTMQAGNNKTTKASSSRVRGLRVCCVSVS